MINVSRLTRIFTVVIVVLSLPLGGCALRTEVERKESTIDELEASLDDRSDTIAQLRGRIDKKDQTIRRLKEDIASLEERSSSLEEENVELEDQVGSLTEQLGSVREKRDELESTLAEQEDTEEALRNRLDQLEERTEEQLRTLRTENRSLEENLSELEEASTRREGNNLVITLDSRILFDLGDHRLKSESKSTLDSIADVFSEYSDRPIAVEGHTDTVPVKSGSQFPTNWHLSSARSVSVVQYLTQRAGLDPDRFRAVGYGEYDPLRPNTSRENRRLNRRVEIILYPPEFDRKSIDPDTGRK